MSKYIDSHKLIAEIERLYDIAREASYNGEIEGEMTAYDKILPFITALQQEQPEVDLEKEIENYFGDVVMMPNCSRITLEKVARRFYELGQRTKYQQDRAEFAKLKAKEWQDGYDEGYAKGLNAKKEGAK